MQNKRFKPKYDKLFWFTWIPTVLMLTVATVFAAIEPAALFIMVPTDIFTLYFLFTSLAGYVELRDDTVFIKFGFILKKEIPYAKIRGASKERKLYSDSMVALKNSLEHVSIKYNIFDIASVSVCENDDFLSELSARLEARK